MAACVLDGDKVCEVAGNVKWSSMDRFMADYSSGSLAIYKLSSSYYIHGITGTKRVKYLLRPDNFQVFYRESRLTLSITPDKSNKGAVSIHLKDAAPNQLRTFLDSLNVLKTYFAAFRGKLSSSSTREENKQNIENQPHNNNNFTSPRVTKYESPLRSNLVTSTPNQSAHRSSPNFPSNYHAKQMNPPSSYSSQNKKTPLGDQTFARENLSNTSSSKKSASSFYGSRISGWSPSNRKSTSSTWGPGLMPPPRPKIQSTLASQISFRSREKNPFVKDVALTGFSNLGNTCYMNAILQSLLGLPPFVQDLLNKTLLDEVHPQCLYSCLYNVLYCKKKGGNPEVLKNWLKKLKQTISEAATRFSGYHQHDAHEFLCQVFDQLKDDVSLCCSPSSKDTSNETNKLLTDTKCPVTRSFESGVVHTVSCKQCGESTPKEEIYHAFSLDIPVLCNSSSVSSFGAVSMQTLIEKHFKNEELEYTCSKCESKEAVISHSFSRLPRVLILHLKRYGYDNLTEEQAKKQDKVNIERFIDLRNLCSSKSKAPLLFQPKSSLKLSPAKSNRKPQKRHYIKDDDDDDVSNDFQPSPSVRRKLAHSFLDTMTSSTANDSSQNTKVNNSEDGVEITGIFKSKKASEHSKLDKPEHRGDDKATTSEDGIQLDVDQNANLEHTPRNEIPVWERPEEDQIKYVLAESAKAAERESRVKMKEPEWNRTVTKSHRKTETDSCDLNNEDFNFLSDLSDEDLVSATQESGPEEVHGLKGGGPITYTTQQQSQDFDFDSILEMDQNKNSTVDSGSEKSPSVLKNRPIRKRPNCYQARKPKTPGEVSVTRTPSLGKFDGDLFEDSVKENKVKTNDISVSDSPKRSWFSGSFRDEDMAKAINLSLQDQKMMTEEDEELNRALQLSLREFEGSTADEPVPPAGVDTENLTDSTFQDEGGELSTHSYRLISIVSHLGSSSTSGHYISDVYDCKTKQWTSYDDSTATKVTEHGVRYKRQHSGYIFFYLYKQCVDAIENASPSKENTQR